MMSITPVHFCACVHVCSYVCICLCGYVSVCVHAWVYVLVCMYVCVREHVQVYDKSSPELTAPT